jgi:hypothetical protein
MEKVLTEEEITDQDLVVILGNAIDGSQWNQEQDFL